MKRTLALMLTGALAWGTLATAAPAYALEIGEKEYQELEKRGYGATADHLRRMPADQKRALTERAEELNRKLERLSPGERREFEATFEKRMNERKAEAQKEARRQTEQPYQRSVSGYDNGSSVESAAGSAAIQNNGPEKDKGAAYIGVGSGEDVITTYQQPTALPEANSASHWGDSYKVVDTGGRAEKREKKAKAEAARKEGYVPMKAEPEKSGSKVQMIY